MTAPFVDEEEWDDITLFDREVENDMTLDEEEAVVGDDGEITLDDVEALEEDENTGHRVQTYDPNDDGVDNYFDERYFDE